MRSALIFASGMTSAALIYWFMYPTCHLGSFLAGALATGAIGMATLFVSNSLEKR